MKTKWNNKEANLYIKKYLKKGINKELALRIYTTRLLGNDSKIVLHGGGNTSLKCTLNNVLNKSTDTSGSTGLTFFIINSLVLRFSADRMTFKNDLIQLWPASGIHKTSFIFLSFVIKISKNLNILSYF